MEWRHLRAVGVLLSRIVGRFRHDSVAGCQGVKGLAVDAAQ